MIPLVIVPPRRAGLPTLAERSAADPARPYHEAGSDRWARSGQVWHLNRLTGRIVLVLAAHTACFVDRFDLMDALYADDPTGGPDDSQIVDVLRSRSRVTLDALGLTIRSHYSRGIEIVATEPFSQSPTPLGAGRWGSMVGAEYPWIDRAADMRRQGAMWTTIHEVLAIDVHLVSVRRLVIAKHPDVATCRAANRSVGCGSPSKYRRDLHA